MAATDSVTLAWINYCCREGYYRQLQTVCLDSLKKYGSDAVLVFWKGFALLMEGATADAIRELQTVKERRDVIICAHMALIVAYKRTSGTDKATIQQLEARLKSERTQCSEIALYFGAMFLLHNGKPDKAREYVDRMLKMSNNNPQGIILKGWADLKCSKEQYVKKSIKYFEESLGGPVKEIDALLGKIEYLKMKHQFTAALETVNQLVVIYPDFYPGLIEKMRVQLALQDWDQVWETSDRVFSMDGQSIEGLHITVLYLICQKTDYDQAVEKITDLIKALDHVEPANPALYFSFAKCYARLCGRNKNILAQTLTLMERTKSLSPKNASYANEMGYQLMLQGKVRDSMKAYQQAMKIDESSAPALTGIILCQILEDQVDYAEQQLEFFNEIQSTIGKTAEVLYLSALCGMKKGRPSESVLQLLQECMETHFKALAGLPLGSKYYELLNPDFLIQIVEMYLLYAPSEPQESSNQANNPILKKCALIIDPVVKTVPGLIEAISVLAKVKYIAGDIDNGKILLTHCLDNDPTYVKAHILLAQIHLYQNNYSACETSLENGLSYNFEVKESPIYFIIRAKIQKKQNQLNEALKTLTAAMNLPGVKSAASPRKKAKSEITLSNRVSVYLELADVQQQLHMQHEAIRTIQDAINEFAGTPEEIKVTLANCDMMIAKGDVEQALELLRKITPEESYYMEAREKMADIYLKNRKDEKLYTSVYRELVEQKPTIESYLLLGDAYMNIQEPERAINVYESAMKKNPRDQQLASKIGQALIRTHQYSKAISYYEAAVRGNGEPTMRLELAELHMKLNNYEKAERILKQNLKGDESPDELKKMIHDAKCAYLLARICLKRNSREGALEAFLKAKEIQTRVIKRAGIEQPDDLPQQKKFAAQLSSALGEYYKESQQFEEAIKCYKEATRYSETDNTYQLALAELFLANSDLDACQQHLMSIMKGDKENQQATLMLADLMFRKNEYDAATFHFQQILEKHPANYAAMAKLVELLRRTGKIHESEKLFEQASMSNGRAPKEAGYNYCKGLDEWYRNNASAALKHFNLARKDVVWGEKALYSMVEICLNPDSEIIGGETFETTDSKSSESTDSEEMALKTADKLLNDFTSQGSLKYKILQNKALTSTKDNRLVQKALNNLVEIAQTYKDYVPALLGIATCHLVLKQSQKARNQLKRIAKMPWVPEDGDDFEKTWLLLADTYIQSNKYDMATELLKKCIDSNESCAKAWEYLGFVMEKDQNYAEASAKYEKAWTYSNEANPAIGYRLAFNYLKSQRYIEAIDVCHTVLGKHPNYPKIRKDIMEKSRNLIRT